MDDANPVVRRVAVQNAVLALETGTVDRLLRLYNDATAAEERPAIVTALGATEDPRAMALVVTVLRRHSENSELLLSAIAAARRKGGASAQEGLTSVVAGDIAPRPLAAALRAVGDLGTAEAVPAIQARLKHRDVEVRAAAVDALGRIGGEQAAKALISALDDANDEIRRLTVNALGRLRATVAIPHLLEAYRDSATRQEAIAALARTPDPRALDVYLDGLGVKNAGLREECCKALATVRETIRGSVRERLAAGLLAEPVVLELATIYAGDRELAPFFARSRVRWKPGDYATFAAAQRGDPKRGQSLFADNGTRGAGCIKCHRVNGAGGDGGPDLSRIAATYARGDLIDSVLFPSKRVADGFRTTLLSLTDGRAISGLVVADGDQRVVLVDSQGTRHELRKSDIAERTQSDASPMPEGIQAGLTLEEFADLIAYLQTLR
jgi:putative heme-binding domain-containing protein